MRVPSRIRANQTRRLLPRQMPKPTERGVHHDVPQANRHWLLNQVGDQCIGGVVPVRPPMLRRVRRVRDLVSPSELWTKIFGRRQEAHPQVDSPCTRGVSGLAPQTAGLCERRPAGRGRTRTTTRGQWREVRPRMPFVGKPVPGRHVTEGRARCGRYLLGLGEGWAKLPGYQRGRTIPRVFDLHIESVAACGPGTHHPVQCEISPLGLVMTWTRIFGRWRDCGNSETPGELVMQRRARCGRDPCSPSGACSKFDGRRRGRPGLPVGCQRVRRAVPCRLPTRQRSCEKDRAGPRVR
mmetsp:Transcript_48631/g.135889  ORF Transcript_48631/g.135889 Transcript_48631/m.135889 type:complete len:295 (+) Transcript_48631:1311-2195(+)